MTIRFAVPESQMSGLVLHSVKLVSAVAVFLALMGTVMNALSRTGSVSASTAAPGTSSRGTVLPAKLAAAGYSTVLADVQARVTSVAVAPGDQVEAGQAIAQLESPEIAIGAEVARRRNERAQERLALLEKAGKGIDSSIDREENLGAVRRVEAAQERLAGFQLDAREHSYAEARQRAEEMQGLLKRQLATAAEAEQSARDEQNEKNALESARQQRIQLGRDAEEAEAQLRIVKMRMARGTYAELLSARTEADEARVEQELAASRLAGLEVVAPRRGSVLAVSIAPGDRVIAGTPLFQLSDLSTLDVQVSVSAKVAREIKAGSAVKVRLPTEPPREIASTVASVLLVPDSRSQGYQVRIAIPNPDPASILAGLDCAVVFPYLNDGESWLKRLF